VATTARYTVTEKFTPDQTAVTWTARTGRTIAVKVDAPQEHGMYDTDVLRRALAEHAGVDVKNVRPVRQGRRDYGISPRVWEVTPQEEPAAEAPKTCPGCGVPEGEPCRDALLDLIAEAPATVSMAGMPSSAAQQATNAAITADYRAEAAKLLGEGERWVKHTTVSGAEWEPLPVDREGALNLVVVALRAAGVWSISPSVTGGLNLVSPDGDTVFWLQPVTEPRPAAEVLGADPVPADTSVWEGMPGTPTGPGQLPTVDALSAEDYVVQVRSEHVWMLPNHDDGAHMTRAQVISALVRVRKNSADHVRTTVDTGGTLYLSNGYQAARYIPARLIADYSADFCPGCGTPYAVNGDGPCSGGRSSLEPATLDDRAAADERQIAKIVEHLGEHADVQVLTVLEATGLDCASDVDREHALDVARGELACGADVSTVGEGYAVLKRRGRTTTLRAIVPPADEEAVNLAMRFVPLDPAEKGARPYVEIGGALVFVYRENGRLVVSVDVDTAEHTRSDADTTVPMVITVQGNTVYQG
jgi:hypothetical protein